MSYNVHTTQQGIRNKLAIYKYIAWTYTDRMREISLRLACQVGKTTWFPCSMKQTRKLQPLRDPGKEVAKNLPILSWSKFVMLKLLQWRNEETDNEIKTTTIRNWPKNKWPKKKMKGDGLRTIVQRAIKTEFVILVNVVQGDSINFNNK